MVVVILNEGEAYNMLGVVAKQNPGKP